MNIIDMTLNSIFYTLVCIVIGAIFIFISVFIKKSEGYKNTSKPGPTTSKNSVLPPPPPKVPQKQNLRKVKIEGHQHYSIGYFHQFDSEGKAYIEDEEGEIHVMDMKFYILKFL